MLPSIKDIKSEDPPLLTKENLIKLGILDSQTENDNKELVISEPTRLSWKNSTHHNLFKQITVPHWLNPHSEDMEVINYIYTAVSFFISTTLERDNPAYTWVDLVLPDQLQEKLDTTKITIDGSTPNKIFIYK